MVLVFDTETNGLPKSWNAAMTDLWNWPRVVQLAYCKFTDDGGAVLGRTMVIQPDGWEIPTSASDIHGITTEFAQTMGIPAQSALQEFIEAYETCDTLIAHNIAFDYPVLGAELIRYGIKAKKRIENQVCTMKSSTDFCAIPQGRNGYKWPKLIELHTKLFGVGFDGAHDAMVDVQACARCYFELKKLGVIQ